MRMFELEFYSGHTEIVFAANKMAAYGRAIGMKAGRIVRVSEIIIT